jgi:hypothetical protein
MLGMFSPVEILFIGVTLITLVPIIAGGGVIVYMVMRKAARDGVRDAARTAEREQPK